MIIVILRIEWRPLENSSWKNSALFLASDLIWQTLLHILHSKEFLIISDHFQIGKGRQNEKNQEPGRFFDSQNNVIWELVKYNPIL